MTNVIIVSENINFIKKLVDELQVFKLKLHVTKICTNTTELSIYLAKDKSEVILMDKALKKTCPKEILRDRSKTLVVLTYKKNLEIIDTDMALDINSACAHSTEEGRKDSISAELEFIGYKFKYKGTHYLRDTIMQLYNDDNTMVDNLQTVIYPIVGKKYDKTVYNVKSSISKATDHMYCECDSTRLKDYFRLTNDVKPTVKQVIFTIISKLR